MKKLRRRKLSKRDIEELAVAVFMIVGMNHLARSAEIIKKELRKKNKAGKGRKCRSAGKV